MLIQLLIHNPARKEPKAKYVNREYIESCEKFVDGPWHEMWLIRMISGDEFLISDKQFLEFDLMSKAGT